MITNQILDLYILHHLVQEKQGYLEITTNRGWKEISNVLGFGDSGREKKANILILNFCFSLLRFSCI
jgi:hypothetical protein